MEITDISEECFACFSSMPYTTPSAVLSIMIAAILCAEFEDISFKEFLVICEKVFSNNSAFKFDTTNKLNDEKTDDIYTSPFAMKPKVIFKYICDVYPKIEPKYLMYSLIKCAIKFSDLSSWDKNDFLSYCNAIISVKPRLLLKKTLFDTLTCAIEEMAPDQQNNKYQIN